MNAKTIEMKIHAVMHAAVILGIAALASGCQSTGTGPKTAPEPTHWTSTSYSPRWSVPSDLPTYGTPADNAIKVALYGEADTVKRPGYYYLPIGTLVRDAIETAQGLSKNTWWTRSGLQRPHPSGPWEIIRFTWDRPGEEKIILRDGDQLYFGHEVR